MSKLSDAQKAVEKLTGKRDNLQAKLATAQASELTLQASKLELERRCYGAEDGTEEVDIAEVDRAIEKSRGEQRGVSAELVKLVEELNAAQEERRKAQEVAEVKELRHLDDAIEELNVKLRPMLQRRQAIVSRWDISGEAEIRERQQEGAELQSAVEQHQGFSISRRITSEQERVR